MELACPKCAAKVPASAINVDRMIAKCDACSDVFRFESQLGLRSGRARLPKPRSIRVEGESDDGARPGDIGYRESARTTGGRLGISRRWFSPMSIFTLVFAIVWCGFLTIWYATAFAGGAQLEALLFPLLHVAVGFFLFYWSIASFVNRTRIVVDGGRLSVRHGPLPWPGSRDLEVRSIKQLFVRTRVTHTKNGTSSSYALCADVDGTAIDLVRGLSQADEARYIEQVIEEHLSIEDDPSASDST